MVNLLRPPLPPLSPAQVQPRIKCGRTALALCTDAGYAQPILCDGIGIRDQLGRHLVPDRAATQPNPGILESIPLGLMSLYLGAAIYIVDSLHGLHKVHRGRIL